MSSTHASFVDQRRVSSYEPREAWTLHARVKDLFAFKVNKSKRLSSQLGGKRTKIVIARDELRRNSCNNRAEMPPTSIPYYVRTKESTCDSEEVPPSPKHLVVHRDGIDRQTANSVPQPQFLRNPFVTEVDQTAEERPGQYSACNAALAIPEVVENILRLLDEISWQSKSLGLNRQQNKDVSPMDSEDREECGSMNACATVNQVFYWAAKRILSTRVELKSMEQLDQYAAAEAGNDNLCRDLLVHRIKTCEQAEFDRINQYRLKSLELYVCPKLVPAESLLSSGTLLKLALPGCGLVDDSVMQSVARLCKHLEVLDLRACELVTDMGIVAIAENCPRLSYLNVGRVKNSAGITDRSLTQICQLTSVETLGLAGCSIGDEGVFAIAQHRGPHIERLSMNQCHAVSDYSLVSLLKASPKLQVLEIVGCEQVSDAEQLYNFKSATGALVETSTSLAMKIKLYERLVKSEFNTAPGSLTRSQRRVTTI